MNILNLEGWEVADYEQGNDIYMIGARYTIMPSACPQCGVMFPRLHRFGRKHQEYKDLPIHGKRVVLIVEHSRFRCQECQKTFYEHLKDLDEKRRATVRFVQYVAEKSLTRTFTSIAEELGVDEKTIRNIFRDHIDELEKRFVFVTPRWLGIDELHMIKPRGILTNIEERSMFDMLEDRSTKTVVKRLRQIKDKEKIELVAIDMWKPYRDAVNTVLPDAIVVIDKFHVVKMVNKALEAVRKKVRGDLTDKQRRALMHDRYILLRRKKDLKEDQIIILESWLATFQDLKVAYLLKESFFTLWDTAKTSASAREMYLGWKMMADESSVAWAFEEMETSIENWDAEIFAYFDHRITNAYTEGLNGLTKIANRLGRGYSFKAIRAKMLFSVSHQKSPKKANVIAEPKIIGEPILSVGVAFEDLIKMAEPGSMSPEEISTQRARIKKMNEILADKPVSTHKPKPDQDEK